MDLLITVLAVCACVLLARILDRAKWVWITDDRIIISDKRQEISLPFSEIESVSVTPYFKPDRIRISFCSPTLFGDSVVFFPPTDFFASSWENPVFSMLASRLSAQRDNMADKR